MGLTMEQKQMIREKVAQGLPPPPPPAVQPARPVISATQLDRQRLNEAMPVTVTVPVLTDELVIEVTGNGGTASVTLRPFEVSRLRGRYGRSPGFEQWVVARVRDAMVSFGGG